MLIIVNGLFELSLSSGIDSNAWVLSCLRDLAVIGMLVSGVGNKEYRRYCLCKLLKDYLYIQKYHKIAVVSNMQNQMDFGL